MSESDDYFTCSTCGRQIVPHTTTSWRTDDGKIVSLSQYADIAAVTDEDGEKRCLCVECYQTRRFGSSDLSSAQLYEVHLQAGKNFQLLREFDSAMAAFGEALALEKTAELYAAIGSLQLQIGQTNQAADSFGTGLSIDRHDPVCLESGIELYLENRDLNLARQWLGIAAEVSGKKAIPQQRLLFLRARLSLLDEDLENAQRLFGECLQLIDDPRTRTDYQDAWSRLLSSRSSS